MKQGWEIKSFEECIVKVKNTTKVSTNNYLRQGKYPIVSQEDNLISGYWNNENDVFHISTPVVIFGDHTRVLKYVDFDFVLGADGVKILQPIDVLNAKFFKLYLEYCKIPSLGYSRHYKLLKEINVPIPPFSEQEKIVAELDCLSGIIEKKKQQLKELDVLAQSIFYEMFGNPVENERGFPVYKVDDIITFQGGSQPDKSNFEYKPTENNIRLIQIRDYKSDKNITYIPKSMAKRLCTADDIMIGRYGPPIFQILKGIEGAYNVALMKAIPKQGNREFVRAFLKQKCLLEYLESMSKRTAGQDGIQMDKLKTYPFPLPPLSLQEEFASKIESIEQQQALIKQSIVEVETLFNSRMDFYFN